jgi:hypothetical protein
MNFNNIFSKTVVEKRPTLRVESADFDFNETVIEALNVLEDSAFEITKEHMVSTHIYLKDGDEEILQEGFKDFGSKVVEFLSNMIKKFKEFMGRVMMIFRAHFGKFDTFLSKYKNTLNSLNPDFTVDGYTYTIESHRPKMELLKGLVIKYNMELGALDKKSKADITLERERAISNKEMDKLRGHLVGLNEIESGEFQEVLKRMFRNGMDSTESIQVDQKLIRGIVNRDYEISKNLYKETIKQKDAIILLLESLKDFFKKSASVHYKDDTKVIQGYEIRVNDKENGIKRGEAVKNEHSESRLAVANAFYDYKWVQAKEIGSICIIAVTEKLTALKESLKLQEKIVRKALMSAGIESEEKK